MVVVALVAGAGFWAYQSFAPDRPSSWTRRRPTSSSSRSARGSRSQTPLIDTEDRRARRAAAGRRPCRRFTGQLQSLHVAAYDPRAGKLVRFTRAVLADAAGPRRQGVARRRRARRRARRREADGEGSRGAGARAAHRRAASRTATACSSGRNEPIARPRRAAVACLLLRRWPPTRRCAGRGRRSPARSSTASPASGLSDVRVQIQGQPGSVLTDARGQFTLRRHPAGSARPDRVGRRLRLVRRDIELGEGGSIYLVIPLTEGTGTYTERVEVTGDLFRQGETGVPAQQVLGSADLQNLRGLVLDDPVRAMHDPAGRRRHRRPLLRVLRARQRLRAHRPGGGRRAQPLSQPQRAGRRGRRLDRR